MKQEYEVLKQEYETPDVQVILVETNESILETTGTNPDDPIIDPD